MCTVQRSCSQALKVLYFSVPAPPSYNESVFGRVNVKDDDDDEHTRGNLDYAPAYTYYDWGHHPTTMSGNK